MSTPSQMPLPDWIRDAHEHNERLKEEAKRAVLRQHENNKGVAYRSLIATLEQTLGADLLGRFEVVYEPSGYYPRWDQEVSVVPLLVEPITGIVARLRARGRELNLAWPENATSASFSFEQPLDQKRFLEVAERYYAAYISREAAREEGRLCAQCGELTKRQTDGLCNLCHDWS